MPAAAPNRGNGAEVSSRKKKDKAEVGTVSVSGGVSIDMYLAGYLPCCTAQTPAF